jgi:hypothetical protein
MPGMLIYEGPARYDAWLKLTLVGVLALTLVLGLVFLFVDVAAAATLFGVTAFDALLFNFIMPRSYRIYFDRLVIVPGSPFSLTVPLSDIKSVRRVSGLHSLVSSGLRFSTSTGYVLEIARLRGMDLVISPANGDLFLEQFNAAVKSAGTAQTGSRPPA